MGIRGDDLRIIHHSKINVPANRQRREFNPDRLSELADSIATTGLIHPLVVHGDGTLAAGERRLRAVRLLAMQAKNVKFEGRDLDCGYVPVLEMGELSQLEALRIELDENVIRDDLTWQERTAALARRFELESSLRSGLSFSDVGQMIDSEKPSLVNGQAVQQAVVLQKAIATNPDIAKAATQQEAWKLLKRSDERIANEILAGEVGKMATHVRHRVYMADCRDWLPLCDDRFDCILIDPPYGMDADQFGDAAGRLQGIEHNYEDSKDGFRRLMEETVGKLFEVSQHSSHLYIWCDIDQFGWLKELVAAAGWWTFRTPLINIKREGGRVPWPEHGPRRCYEIVLYAVRGKRPCTAIYRDVFESTLERDTGGHGAIKPVEAYMDLLKRSCRPGDLVLDCFAGTGTIISAAENLGLRSVAVERDAAAYGECIQRLEALNG